MDKAIYEKANRIHGEILNNQMMIAQIKLFDAINLEDSNKNSIRKIQKKIKKLEQEFEEL